MQNQSKATTWAGMFPVHPAADVFPMMGDDELKQLASDIKTNGLRHPVKLWRHSGRDHDERLAGRKRDYYVLDGRNRLAAMDLAGIPVREDWRALRLPPGGEATLGSGTLIFEPADAWSREEVDVDPATFVISANIHRRHMTKTEQAEAIVKAAAATEEFSARLAQNPVMEERAPGRPKDPVRQKAIAEGAKYGISERTVERAISSVKPLAAEAPQLPVKSYREQLQANVMRLRRKHADAQRRAERAHRDEIQCKQELDEAERLLREYREAA